MHAVNTQIPLYPRRKGRRSQSIRILENRRENRFDIANHRYHVRNATMDSNDTNFSTNFYASKNATLSKKLFFKNLIPKIFIITTNYRSSRRNARNYYCEFSSDGCEKQITDSTLSCNCLRDLNISSSLNDGFGSNKSCMINNLG